MVKYLVCMKKRTRAEKDRFFICTKAREEFGISLFHGVGYWHFGDKDPLEDIESKIEEEVWIPLNNIDYVKSLMYKPR